MAHNLQSDTAVIVAVLWQLYNMANSPNTLAPDNVDKYFPSRDTSTRPSVDYKMKGKVLKNQQIKEEKKRI